MLYDLPKDTQYVVKVTGQDELLIQSLTEDQYVWTAMAFTLSQANHLVDALMAACNTLRKQPEFAPRYISRERQPHA